MRDLLGGDRNTGRTGNRTSCSPTALPSIRTPMKGADTT